MRPIPSLLAALSCIAALAGCGTKTPLTLPPQPQPPAKAAALPVPSTVESPQALALVTAEPRQ
jgi:predicted small lipoprotein YifL